MSEADWNSFFDPKVVCVVGASSDPKRIGGRLVRYSQESGYGGQIIPVNPNRSSIFGLPARKSLTEVDETPDWVLVAVPRDHVVEAVEQAGRIGARNVCVVAAGFAEVDEHGAELQRHLTGLASAYGFRLLGPNSNGFMNVATGAYFAFTPVIDSARPTPGQVAVVTQSAAIGTYLVNWCRNMGLGIRNWVHTGNESDLTALEVTRALAERGEVAAIALSFEVLRDLPRLRDTLRVAAANGVAVGVLQAGLSPAGKRASQAHTAALIGAEAEVLADLVNAAGGFACRSVSSLANVLQVAVNHRRIPAEPRVGLVSTSGGVGVLMADALEAHGLTLPLLSTETQQRIREYAPYCHPANPVDTTAQVINDPTAFQRIVSDCVDSGELDLLAVFIAHGLAGAKDPTLRQLIEVARSEHGATALAALGVLNGEAAAEVQALGVSVFAEPADVGAAVSAYVAAVARRKNFLTHESTPPSPAQAWPAMTGPLDEVAAKDVLRRAGAAVASGQVVAGSKEAVEVATRLGLPVVLKLISESLPHKADQGGVKLNLWTSDAVAEAFTELSELGRELAGDSFRILVEEQLAGPEVFLGCVRHPTLGSLVGIGPGGSGVENSRAVRWQWAPLTIEDVPALIEGGPLKRLSDGHVRAIVEVAAVMAGLVATGPDTVETNPVILTADGRAVVADALVTGDRP
jgi:acyl-CoA synthetase (NDP forming)